ncbi:MAG: site-specific integrase [Clostridia bacterium]|nr:site-specific integrase [Clostridia bacterium]
MPSYEKSKASGLWSVRFREVSPQDGKTKNKRLSGFKTKKEAQYGYEDYVSAKKTAAEQPQEVVPSSSPADMPFSSLVEEYLQFKRSRIKEPSFYDVQKKVSTKIAPFFGDTPIKEISPSMILKWQNSLEGYSYAYRKTLMTHLSLIYNYAERYYDIPNVIRKVDKPRNLEPKKEMLFWSPEEFSSFISCVERKDYAMLFRFLYLSGCRKGEALALTWQDVDLAKGTVSISKSFSNKAHDEGKSYTITTPKNTSSNRTVHLPRFFCDMLKEYRDWQQQSTDSINFVFGGADPLPPSNIDRTLAKAADAAGVKRIRIHDLRHSCASLLIHKGVSIVAVSRHLGHSTVEQTLNTYSHMLPDDQTMILNTLSTLEGKLGT